MENNKKKIHLSWLVEKWTLWDDDYIKNIWLNTESLDLVRISEAVQSDEDLENSYIDIENNPEDFICMPGRESCNQRHAIEAFIDSLGPKLRKEFYANDIDFLSNEEFLDKLYELGLEEDYNDFRKSVFAKILWDWAMDEDLSVDKDMELIDIYHREN